MASKHTDGSGVRVQAQKSKKYRDRPTDDGKHGDGSEEPNSGVPTSPTEAPARPKPAGSRQHTPIK